VSACSAHAENKWHVKISSSLAVLQLLLYAAKKAFNEKH
jgi:hypothetical protein